MRLALAELGKDAKTAAIQSFVKERFNIDMTAGHAKTSKGKILREAAKEKAAGKPATARKPAPASQVKPAPAKPAAKAAARKGRIAIADVLTLDRLLERVGAKELLTLLDVMAK